MWLKLMAGDIEAAEHHCAKLLAYSAEKKLEQWRLLATAFLACARAMRQPSTENISMIRAAIEAENRSGGHVCDSYFLSFLAHALLMAGDMAAAETTLQQCFAFVDRSGERFWLPEMHRLEGRIALQKEKPDRQRAKSCFLLAMDVARIQDARMLELRAATDLARLRHDAGAARTLLAPILAGIEGGESGYDVRNARALVAA